jgi:hypothetical protein
MSYSCIYSVPMEQGQLVEIEDNIGPLLLYGRGINDPLSSRLPALLLGLSGLGKVRKRSNHNPLYGASLRTPIKPDMKESGLPHTL